jgi:signal peptidase I
VLHASIALGIAAIALETWFIQGLIVPLTVDGGSMAETVLGPHRQVECRACGHRFAVGLEQLPANGQAVCGNCGYGDNEVQSLPDRAGHRLLVDRTAFVLQKPQRWELAVFRCPERPDRHCLKRVVGLPGETVEIRRGDVFINGRIARKDLAAQRAVAQLVHQMRPVLPGQPDIPSRWRAATIPTHWQRSATGFNVPLSTDRSAPLDWLEYHHPGGGVVQDDVSYNQRESRVLFPITDLMLSCVVRASGLGSLLLAAGDARHPFEVHIPNCGVAMRVWQDARLVAEAPLEPGALDQPVRLELSLVDAQLLVALRDQVRVQYLLGSRNAPPVTAAPRFAVAARGLAVELRQLTVRRDVYYTQLARERRGGQHERTLADNEFFVLGDNSPISDDSRCWRPGVGLTHRLLVGRPIGVR